MNKRTEKRQNLAQLLAVLRRYGPLTQARIKEYCGLQASTVKQLHPQEGECKLSALGRVSCSEPVEARWWNEFPEHLMPTAQEESHPFRYTAGEPIEIAAAEEEQGYVLSVSPRGIVVQGADSAGLRYGLDTLGQLLAQAQNDTLPCLTIRDYPSLKHRGLMLDVSRGKVFTRQYLMELVTLLSKLRYNVLQLYFEHTFDFKRHPEICADSDPLTAEDITALQEMCKAHGIELQANLQSLGHCRRILTRPAHMALSESDMFWSFSTTSEGSFQLLDELYEEYLPLFESPWLNVCLDEPYDIGCGQSADAKARGEDLYLTYFQRIHQLAGKYGKHIMAFADVFLRNPESMAQMPDDVIYLDWCYDPKEHYGTPAKIGASGRKFWVCPGTGNWNTLFPRLDGAVSNIVQLLREGMDAGADGMLLTDWNDHGAYAQPGPGYEDQLRLLIKRYVRLQLDYVKIWLSVARPSEIELSITYFAHIIERLDYLKEWLSVQRERTAAGRVVDYDFDTYETAGYRTLPTY